MPQKVARMENGYVVVMATADAPAHFKNKALENWEKRRKIFLLVMREIESVRGKLFGKCDKKLEAMFSKCRIMQFVVGIIHFAEENS